MVIFRGWIRNWQIHNFNEEIQVFTGTIIHDPTGRFKDGWHMRSSPIKKFDRETGEVTTENSLYNLDMKTENQDHNFPGDLGQAVALISY